MRQLVPTVAILYKRRLFLCVFRVLNSLIPVNSMLRFLLMAVSSALLTMVGSLN